MYRLVALLVMKEIHGLIPRRLLRQTQDQMDRYSLHVNLTVKSLMQPYA